MKKYTMKQMLIIFICMVITGFLNVQPINAEEWETMTSETTTNLTGVWANDGKAFAVGEKGTILYYDGTAWSQMTSGISNSLMSIWGSAENDLYAVGNNGIILQYDGVAWKRMTTSETPDIFTCAWGTDDGDLFIAGFNGRIIHFKDKNLWTELTGGTPHVFMGLWGTSGNNLFAVGNVILRYDGFTWTEVMSNPSNLLWDIWGTSMIDVFAVGNKGTILHYNGTDWTDMTSDAVTDDLRGIWGTSGSDVYAVSSRGKIYHYDGVSWSLLTGTTIGNIQRIWMDTKDEIVYAVGDNGKILRQQVAGNCPGGLCWVVQTGGDDENGNGSETAPFATIQHAIDMAVNGKTVVLRDGTYTGDKNKNLDFKGKAITVRSENDSATCIIDCEESGRGFYFHNGEGERAVISNLTINKASESAIYCESASPTIENCIITANTKAGNGAGIYCDAASPVISSCTISNNTVDGGNGAGIYCTNESSPMIKNNTVIIGNQAINSGNGGGIACDASSSPDIQKSIVTNNEAESNGGGIYASASLLEIRQSIITSNSAANGGGLYALDGSDFIITNSILWNDAPQEIYFQSDLVSNTITIKYSDVQSGEAGIVDNDNGTVNWLDSNIDADPIFTDAANGDYTLQPGSPCINAGGCEVEPCVFTGSSPDIGVFESIYNGLIAHYVFDGDATDQTGNGYDGTVYGATLTADRFGNPNSAYSFDGDDYIELIKTLNTNDVKAVSFWFNNKGISGSSNAGVIIGKYDFASKRNFAIWNYGTDMFANHIWASYWNDPSDSFANRDYLNTLNSKEIELDTWKQVVVNLTSTEMEIWINGQLINSVTRNYTTYYNDDTPTYIGNLFNFSEGDNNYFNGILDDLRIYNRALSEDEIFSLAESGLTGYWKFDDDSGDMVIDATGNGNHATVFGVTRTKGVYDSALIFKENASLQLPGNMSDYVSNHFTVGMWINISNIKDTQYLFHADDDRPGIFLQQENKVRFASDNGEEFSSPDPLPTRKWIHVACTWDGSAFKGYLNGELTGQKNLSAFQLGGRILVGSDGSPDTSFNGMIDDLRIYDRALSPNEMRVLGTGMVGYWKADEAGGNTLIDSSGNSRNGTVHNQTGTLYQSTDGVDAGALDLTDGENYVAIPDDGSLSLTGPMTLSAWVQIHELTAHSQRIIYKTALSGANNDNYSLYFKGETQRFSFLREDSSSDTDKIVLSTTIPEIEQWYHVAGVYDGEKMSIYVNGIIENTNNTGGFVPYTGSADLILGSNYSSNHSDAWANMVIDDIRIYNRALSETEIQKLSGVLYVDPEFNGTGNGTPETPFTTIGTALNNAISGSIIRIAEANYEEILTIADIAGVRLEGAWINDNGIWTRDSLIDPNLTVILTGDTTTEPAITINNAPGTVIDGLALQNGVSVKNSDNTEITHDLAVGISPIHIEDSNDVLFKRNKIVGKSQDETSGFGVVVSNSTVEISENTIRADVIGVHYTNSSNGSITSNVIHVRNTLNPGMAIKLESPLIAEADRDIQIENNVLYLEAAEGIEMVAIEEVGTDATPNALLKNQFFGDKNMVLYSDGNGIADIKAIDIINATDPPGTGTLDATPLNNTTLSDISDRGGNTYQEVPFFDICGQMETASEDGADTETTDSGTTDSGTTDSETTDSGTTDNETTDNETTDSETTDSGTTDSETTDSETTDSEEPCIHITFIPKPFTGEDSDGDMLPDDWEILYFGDLSRNGTGDFDNDGLRDIAEYRHGTNPTNEDTEGDGMPDGWEVKYILSPLLHDARQDPDGDGYISRTEYAADTHPRSLLSFPKFDPDSGIFKVGESGIVTVNWIYDGGAYEGEVGIFKVDEALKEFDNNLNDFIREVTRRVLSNSNEGYLVFSDKEEGAQFSGILCGEETDQNHGLYKGSRHFEMTTGDQFAVILAPSCTLQALYDDPSIKDSGPGMHPFFSFPSSNSDYGTHLSRISDINGAGIAFVYEDMDLYEGDVDYNDLVFQVGELEGDAPILRSLVDKDVGEIPTAPENIRLAMQSELLGKQILDHLDMQMPEGEAIWMSVITDCTDADLLVFDSQERSIGKEGGYISGATFEFDEEGRQIASWLIGFKVTEQTLENLMNEAVPEDVIIRLRGLKHWEYTDENVFAADLENAIGTEQLLVHKSAILKHTKRFKITDKTIEELLNDGTIPEDLIEKIEDLKEREYMDKVDPDIGESKFEKDLKKAIGADNTTQYQPLILEHVEYQYRLLKYSLDSLLTDESLPENIILKLRGVNDHVYTDEAKFVTDLNTLIGAEQTELYKNQILNQVERSYCLTQYALDQLETESVPSEEMMIALKDLIDDEYRSEAEFVKALNALEGITITENDRLLILEYVESLYRLTQTSLDQLSSNGLSQEVLIALESLKDVEYISEAAFVDALNALEEITIFEDDKTLILQYVESLYRLTQHSLEQLYTAGLSQEVMNRLESLKDIAYPDESAFEDALTALEDGITIEESLKPSIVKYAKDSKYRIVLQGRADAECNLTIKQYQGQTEIDSIEKTVKIEAHKATSENIFIDSNDSSIKFEEEIVAPTPAASGDPSMDEVPDVSGDPPIDGNTIPIEVEEPSIQNDLDGDGNVEVFDIMKVASKWDTCEGNQDFDPFYDLNDDGCITVSDIMLVVDSYNLSTEQ